MYGLNGQQAKQFNKAFLLKIIATQGPISRIKLSELTQLSKMTISNLVSEYIAEGIVFERGIEEASTGRKPILLDVVPDSLLTLGVYISRDYVQAGIVDLKGATLRSERIHLSVTETETSFMRKLFMLTDSVVKDEIRQKLWGIGISSIGPLNVHDGLILNPPNFHNIRNLSIIAPLSERYNLPAYLENDMNVSALAEMYFGNGQTTDNFVYVGVTSGVGAGIVINRKLYNGNKGFGGEIGHTTVCIDGNLCGCGNRGCLETYASVPAALEWASEEFKKQGLVMPEHSWLWLVDSAAEGNEICRAALKRMCRHLAAALVTVVNLFDPECIFIGGDIGFTADTTIPYLNEYVERFKFSPSDCIVPVFASKFPGNATFVGTAALVLERNLEYNKQSLNISIPISSVYSKSSNRPIPYE